MRYILEAIQQGRGGYRAGLRVAGAMSLTILSRTFMGIDPTGEQERRAT